MTDETKRTRLKGYDRILAAAKALPLKDRVELVKELRIINVAEVDGLRKQAEEADTILKS